MVSIEKKKHKKMSKTKSRRIRKRLFTTVLIFFLIEVFLLLFFFYLFDGKKTITDDDVYKIKTKVVETYVSNGRSKGRLYIETTNGYFNTSSSYMEGGTKYCKEVADLLLEDSEVELTVLKDSESFSFLFMDQASVVVGIESATIIYSTMEMYNEFQDADRPWLIVSFIIFETITVGAAIWTIVYGRRIFFC